MVFGVGISGVEAHLTGQDQQQPMRGPDTRSGTDRGGRAGAADMGPGAVPGPGPGTGTRQRDSDARISGGMRWCTEGP